MKLNHQLFLSVRILILGLFLFLGSATIAFAQEADASVDDLVFTEMGSETDTAAVAPVNADSLKNIDSAKSAVDTTKMQQQQLLV